MATPSALPFSLNFLLLLALTPIAFSMVPSSYVASNQLEFWSKNVFSVMPVAVASKLSPLSKQDSDTMASLLSKQSLSFNAKFCSMANLACSSSFGEGKVSFSNYSNRIYRSPNTQYGAKSRGRASDEADPNPNLFFRLSILQKENKVQLPNLNNEIPPRAFLPFQIASKISTTSSIDLQKLFPESFTSSVSNETIQSSISDCTARGLKDEIKSCPNSLEDMIEFSKKALGGKKLITLTIPSTKGSEKQLEIRNVRQFHDKKVVACHETFYPFATYFCHLFSSAQLYVVDFVEPTTKAPVNKILAICHMDTSEWAPDHVAFKTLKFSPGQGEACHWFMQIDLVWIGKGE